MRTLPALLIAFAALLAACGDPGMLAGLRTLPFPTPAQQDLVVLTTPGPLTRSGDPDAPGLESDLAEAFARDLGVGVRFIVVPPGEVANQLVAGKAHLAAAWLTPPGDPAMQASEPLRVTADVLVQNEATLPVGEIAQLAGRTVHAVAGSRQAATLKRLQESVPGLEVVEVDDPDALNLTQAVAERRVELAAVDSTLASIAQTHRPDIVPTLALSGEQPVVWWLGPHPNVELKARLAAFVERIQRDGTLARLDDRYFGHVRRLNQADIIKFLGQIESTLPRLRPHFHAAEALTQIDWRLIAAVAYHESHWDPAATSPTGVRGIMMLTEETADRLGVGNRLDPRESILAGARYINILKETLPETVAEPDRTWLALAAYNIGPGHFNAARRLAELLKADPDAWYEMKRILPLLAQPKFAERVMSGRARGGEAVLLVESIRTYFDILARNASAYEAPRGMAGDPPRLKVSR
ncbi:MAG: membrane-bound lytic murein transglycosylase MltF [Betaproteobacteria bacterium]|nr:membrane-bound lytic murein transglycosylase MltF [Betaproteobacteria bacterium]